MLFLRKPTVKDATEIAAAYEKSQAIHDPWTYPPECVHTYLNQENRYFLCFKNAGTIVGTFNISGIIRGYFQSAHLGYEVFAPYQRQGYMRRGLSLILDKAFTELNLHRLEANIQPENTPSIRLVANGGFSKEGFSKNYLNVGGHGWKDHERWAILNPNWQAD